MSQNHPITISSWTLGDQCTFEERVAAAKAAGFEGIGLRAETYVDALNEGLFDQDLLAILDKYGMKVTEVEYIVQWAEEHRSYEQKYKEQICFHMCELFGVDSINCGLMENYSVEYTAQKLRELCRRAGKIHHRRGAHALQRPAGCEEGLGGGAGCRLRQRQAAAGLLALRPGGQPVDLSVLEGIPAEKIVSIQINDVQAHPYAKSILRDESMHDRMLPGTGYGDTAGFVKLIRDKGVRPAVVGVEVISDEILSRGVAQAAKENYDAARAVLEKTWPEVLEK